MFYSDDSGIVVGIASTTYILILLAGLMVWLGYKTQACACIIALAVFTDAFVRFPFWEGGRNADHKRFHFFQAMTPVGGLLLLVALGPGRFSVDAASKSK
jgi:putative oxidoreductase